MTAYIRIYRMMLIKPYCSELAASCKECFGIVIAVLSWISTIIIESNFKVSCNPYCLCFRVVCAGGCSEFPEQSWLGLYG